MSVLKTCAVFIVKFYQKVISPYSRGSCRFMPTCSNYAIEAINKYGAIKGSILSFKRILRCHPFGSSGYDPLE